MTKIERISISLPEHLLNKLEKLMKTSGHSSRSEVIRNALSGYINEFEWSIKEEGEVIGVINVLYDTRPKSTIDMLISVQHEFINLVTATLHIQGNSVLLEIILVRGDMTRVRKLVSRLAAVKGVKNIKLVVAEMNIKICY